MRISELNSVVANTSQYGARLPATPAYVYNGADDLQRKAAQDGIRLNTRSSGAVRSGNTFYSTKPATYFNKGATLFKAALLTFCFLVIECVVVFLTKDSLNVPIYYPLIPLVTGLLAFAVCSVLYASGYQANAKLNKKSAAYIFSGVILFIVGTIIASMIAVYCKAPLAQPTTFLKFIIVPAVFMTNIILFPTFYHFLAIAKEKETQDEE